MPKVVGVAFKEAGKVYYFSPGKFELKIGDKIIVETSRGQEFGEVVLAPEELPEEEVVTPLKEVIRIATKKDQEKLAENERREKEALKIAEVKIAEHNLPMKLIEVEQVFDRGRIIFYFSAEGRVDFRELVKDLASRLHTRIELRQVGVRDEAKLIGGLGPCGRRLCCTLFLSDFEPVSVKMARVQDLPLNPLKISGVCGRLMCCLKYEYEVYREFKREAPERGTVVEIAQGKGVVVDYNVPQEKVVVELEEGQRLEIPLKDLKKVKVDRP